MASNVYILLGSNQGNSIEQLKLAIQHIRGEIGIIEKSSSVYQTEAWGNTDQAPFSNQVILVQTEKNAQEVLRILLAIEKKMGRKRVIKWEPRVIDLDILFYDSLLVDEQNLVIPHPHLHERRFTLVPMAEISENFIHPKFNKTILELLESCTDGLLVEKISIK
jgi:2-amino-4-hydroxy-6-hydroxymethyldihydropteridine diphosphokinase